MLPSPVLCSFLSSVQFGVPLIVNTKRQSLHFAKTARLQSLSDRGVPSDFMHAGKNPNNGKLFPNAITVGLRK